MENLLHSSIINLEIFFFPHDESRAEGGGSLGVVDGIFGARVRIVHGLGFVGWALLPVHLLNEELGEDSERIDFDVIFWSLRCHADFNGRIPGRNGGDVSHVDSQSSLEVQTTVSGDSCLFDEGSLLTYCKR